MVKFWLQKVEYRLKPPFRLLASPNPLFFQLFYSRTSSNFNLLWDTFVGTRFRIQEENTSSQLTSSVLERSHHSCHNDERWMKRTSRGLFHFLLFAPIFTKWQDGNRTPNLLPEWHRSTQLLNLQIPYSNSLFSC